MYFVSFCRKEKIWQVFLYTDTIIVSLPNLTFLYTSQLTGSSALLTNYRCIIYVFPEYLNMYFQVKSWSGKLCNLLLLSWGQILALEFPFAGGAAALSRNWRSQTSSCSGDASAYLLPLSTPSKGVSPKP